LVKCLQRTKPCAPQTDLLLKLIYGHSRIYKTTGA
jgi:hypothetical protein